MAYSIEEDLEKEINELRFKVKGLEFEVEQLRTQLAGCLAAAMGATKDPAKQGQYGWSTSAGSFEFENDV